MKTPFFEHHNGNPSKGTSEIQKRQMLSFNSNPNISVLQIDSDFDFCQKIVKKMLTENTNYFAAELFMLLRSGHAFFIPATVIKVEILLQMIPLSINAV